MIEGIPEDLTPPAAADLWQTCVDRLAQDIPEQQFNTWIRPLSASVYADASKVVVSVANRFKLDWIRAQYASRIALLLEAIQGKLAERERTSDDGEDDEKVRVLMHGTAGNFREIMEVDPDEPFAANVLPVGDARIVNAAFPRTRARVEAHCAAAGLRAIAVDDVLTDLSRPFEREARVRIITERDPEALQLYRHSTAHLLAAAVLYFIICYA